VKVVWTSSVPAQTEIIALFTIVLCRPVRTVPCTHAGMRGHVRVREWTLRAHGAQRARIPACSRVRTRVGDSRYRRKTSTRGRAGECARKDAPGCHAPVEGGSGEQVDRKQDERAHCRGHVHAELEWVVVLAVEALLREVDGPVHSPKQLRYPPACRLLPVEEAERVHRGRHLRGPAHLVRAHVGTGRGMQHAAATACASGRSALSLLRVTRASEAAIASIVMQLCSF
jgi:hypothetical protein